MMLMASLFFKRFSALAQSNIAGAAIFSIAMSVAGLATQAHAQSPVGVPSEPVLSINDWLLRMHDAAMKKRSYVGTLVQSSPQAISSARIWHACDGAQQVERIETLTGAPRSTFRHNDKLVTFMPEAKLVRVEKQEQIGGFPEVLKPGVGSIPEFYAVKALGAERIAGLDSDVVQLVPKDALRFGYRIWTEKKSSLVLKLQTLDAGGAVLEQAAFSELQLDAPVKMEKLMQMMAATEGYKVDKAAIIKTTATAEGWFMKSPVPGFKSLSCYKRGASSVQGHTQGHTQVGASGSVASQGESTFQWLFSDGLATVSLFVEDFDKARHTQEGMIASGATHTLLKRMNDYWLTAVGEVPPQTLKSFAQSLERKR
jgi:sigma-E factor negative regulatory protein RseB